MVLRDVLGDGGADGQCVERPGVFRRCVHRADGRSGGDAELLPERVGLDAKMIEGTLMTRIARINADEDAQRCSQGDPAPRPSP